MPTHRSPGAQQALLPRGCVWLGLSQRDRRKEHSGENGGYRLRDIRLIDVPAENQRHGSGNQAARDYHGLPHQANG